MAVDWLSAKQEEKPQAERAVGPTVDGLGLPVRIRRGIDHTRPIPEAVQKLLDEIARASAGSK